MIAGHVAAFLDLSLTIEPTMAKFLSPKQIKMANQSLPTELRAYPKSKGGGAKKKAVATAEGKQVDRSEQEELTKALHDSKRKTQTHRQAVSRYTFDQLKFLTGDYHVFMYCMQKMGLIANLHDCPHCGMACALDERKNTERATPIVYWECKCSRNGYTRTIRQGSFFENISHPSKFVDFMFMYLNGMPLHNIDEMLEIGGNKSTEWKQQMQDLCEEMNTHINVQLGGGPDGACVEADGTYLGGKQSQKKGPPAHAHAHTHTHTHAHARTHTHTHTQHAHAYTHRLGRDSTRSTSVLREMLASLSTARVPSRGDWIGRTTRKRSRCRADGQVMGGPGNSDGD
jgi:transposase-like protein